MTFNSYKPFKRKNVFPKFTIVFLLGLSFALFFSNALTIVTGIENATQYIKQIMLTSDWSAKWTTWVVIDWYTSWGRIWSDLYCTKGFDKCINVKGLISTWDIGPYLSWVIKTWDLAWFKSTLIDPLISDLSWKIVWISGALSSYAKLADLGTLATKAEIANFLTNSDLVWFAKTSDLAWFLTSSDIAWLATKSELSNYATVANANRIDWNTTTLFNTLNTLIDNLKTATSLADLRSWLWSNISKN